MFIRPLLPVLILFSCASLDDSDVAPASQSLASLITAEGMMVHLQALQDVADANDSTRERYTDGYSSSIDYLEGALRGAGYVVQRTPFNTTDFEVSAVSLADPAGPITTGFQALVYSGFGAMSAPITAVDLTLPPGADDSSTSGCEASDFTDFPSGNIALLQRGTCLFAEKVVNAEAAGAAAVLLFNEGQSGRQGSFEGSLDSFAPASVPVVGLTFALGEQLAAREGEVIDVEVDGTLEFLVEWNLIAELPGAGEPGVVMLGAHLDSVSAGPGINDNGSGSVFLLELALQAAQSGWQPEKTVRFAWWGAEEDGLRGSKAWVYDRFGEPRQERLDALDAYLNFDMLASFNGARFLADGDGSDIDDEGSNPGSADIEGIFAEWFDEQGLATVPEPNLVPSDNWWFVTEGVPVGALHSGASSIKRPRMVESQGGTAGEPYDSCYHLDCDRLDRVNTVLFEQMAQAAAHVTQVLAERTGSTQARRAPRVPIDTGDAVPQGCHHPLATTR